MAAVEQHSLLQEEDIILKIWKENERDFPHKSTEFLIQLTADICNGEGLCNQSVTYERVVEALERETARQKVLSK